MKKTLILLLTAAVMTIAGCSKKEDTAQEPSNTHSLADTRLLANTGLRNAKAAALPDGDYVITNKHSLKVFDLRDRSVADGTLIQQWEPTVLNGSNAATNQAFHITEAAPGAGVYFIRALNNDNSVLDVKDHAKTNGATVQLWDIFFSDNQAWELILANGFYTIKSHESGNVLDISDSSTANGAVVHLWQPTGADNQLFTITKYVPARK